MNTDHSVSSAVAEPATISQDVFCNASLSEIHRAGMTHIPSFYPEPFLEQIQAECKVMEKQHYHENNLQQHSVYLSDSSPTRCSHAMMIARGNSSLPTVDCSPFAGVRQFLHDYCVLLGKLHKKLVPATSRAMFNWQMYYGQSKPVAEHFDGEYLHFNKVDETHFDLHEALLPRYVALLTIYNENVDTTVQGTVLIDTSQDRRTVTPPSKAGDLLVFDNVRYRHRVPSLPRPRQIVGLRNFDFDPYHFAVSEEFFRQGLKYHAIPEGFVATDIDSDAIQRHFLQTRWEEIYAAQQRDGAVF